MKTLQLNVLMFLCLMSFGQELPPIEKFTTENYHGDNQNWMISQASNNFIYVANNIGLLEYNGAKWVTYPSPNNTIIRAVRVINDKIYTGSYGEFGYWIKNEFGILTYASLASKLENKLSEDEEIWNIIEYKEWVVFQSGDNIYFYNSTTETFKIIHSNNIIYKIFKVDNRIFYHVDNEGIYLVENGKPKLILNHEIVKSGRVINIFKRDENLMLLTRSYGFYTFKNNNMTPWETPADDVFKKVNIFSSIQLKDGSFIVGTISDGVIHLNIDGSINYKITQKTGLNNNTVLCLFEDQAQNVWVGLDNGINCINVKSAIKTYYDYDGVLGTVYSTMVFNNYLYIGSNQGLFYREVNDIDSPFKFIEGTAGQVWDLYNYKDDYLFCGHHLGTFLIKNNKAKNINKNLGAWTFKAIPNAENLILQGNYDGLYILEKVNETWQTRNKVEGFENSSRYFEINDDNQVWVNHEYKGVFKLKLDDSLKKVIKLGMETSLPLGKNTGLIRYKNNIIYRAQEGMFEYNNSTDAFQRDSILSLTTKKDQYISGKLVVDKNDKLWVFSKDNLNYIENDNVTNQPAINNISIPSKLRKGLLGYENISLTSNNKYVLGTTNGYITLDLSKLNETNNHTTYLNTVALQDIEGKISQYKIQHVGEFNHNNGILLFEYSVPEYDKFLGVKYQYKLEGHSNKWSPWTENAQASFENLSFGDYTFKVRVKVGNKLTKNTVSYTFKVDRPWYLSNIAISFYFLLLLLITLITHKAYKRYYNNKFKHEQMENEQTIMQIKNEKLNQDIENKNRELAISTMSIIKKNRVLNKIKKELKKNKDNADNAAVILIDSNLNDTKDWSFFEQAFNNADKDFLEKIKKSHPNLTPNDLRFCAYLRLNLSSKEMAPLLNISIKSVETKRYRLRKKLGLEHDNSLVDYILKF
ncbi:helix-turn-helix and ligand-binding sensor domain-containing protein [Changchengzhania lutea]|uniref:helix-turn-helix and ligand-binding sensor domain-containing protein n=1 Tax=Changchengzhania lutea TaxID=2049305 RepID=UPI00115DABC3|nr:triple tyrosine motif-containing protein [Changchengzhania lutea]